MPLKETHISEDELLLLADGELSARKAESLRLHLSACPICAQRRVELEKKLSHIAAAYKESRPQLWDDSGPHALLKARLAEEQHRHGVTKRHWLRASLRTPSLVTLGALALVVACGFQLMHLQSANTIPLRRAVLADTPLPDRRFTPGLTRNASLADLCRSNREETVRAVPASVERQVLKEYGIDPEASGKYEIDYLITPGLGGADDVKNLWPEPHANTPWNSFAKDLLEDRLHKMVCENKIPLNQAQRDISEDWIAAYKKYYQTTALAVRSTHSAS